MQLDSRIKRAGQLATEAFTYLNKLQQGDKQLLRTGDEAIDCHITGLLPSDCVLYAANSGVGKTKMLYDTLDQILDEKVNPNTKDGEGLTILSSISDLFFDCDFDEVDWSESLDEEKQTLELLRSHGAKMSKELDE